MPLRFGLIGCGEIGRLRAAALTATPDLELAAASDVDQGRASALCSRTFADWKEMIRRPEVDAVIVSTPPSLHSAMSIEALRAGKHVLCEKPLARTPDECARMLEAAERANRVLATGFNYRFYPSVVKAKQLLASGLIGELDHVRSYAGYSANDHNHGWLHDVEVMGGGALRDNGIHLIDLTRYFLGEVAEIEGMASGSVWRFGGCEENGFALLKSTQGKIASLQASWTEWAGYRFQIEIYGERGCIKTSCFPMVTRAIWAAKTGGATQRKTWFFPKVHLMEHLKSYRWVVIQSFIEEFQAFRRSLEGQTSPLASGLDGMRAVEIAWSVVHSSRAQVACS
jgi:predicted dehydrogenase